MFPTVRLLIAAVFTSAVALGCGFGVFAAYRVNHEPISPRAAATVPLQFATGETAPATWGAPIDPRLRLSDKESSTAVTDAPALTPTHGDAAVQNPWTAGTIRPAAMTTTVPMPAPQLVEPSAVPATTTAAASPDSTPSEPATVATIAPSQPEATPAAQSADITGSIGEVAPAKAGVSPKVTRKLRFRATRKIARKIVKRRRLANRSRIAGNTPFGAAAPFGSTNVKDQAPVFASAPHTQNSAKPASAGKTAQNPLFASPFNSSGPR
jgi:hypothetical protein